ncbi:MAG: radical SAM family heme chaperone HemW, partial [Porphyromonas endodontalis]|uniref:radical SAM family heme chaperone HemW n=1 Tax=Porphyromonas endodontalis TaxID=28124 RepID=UPI003620C614
YLHVPFCKSRCAYCAFYSQTNTRQQEAFVTALCRELELRREELAPSIPIETVYFGGGTPSLLSPSQLEKIVDTIRRVYSPQPDAEWTLEGNPDDITPEYAHALRLLGFNRVSLGVQSFCDEELRFLGRRHTARQVYSAIEALRTANFSNISIDLIYSLPGQSHQLWQQNLSSALALEIPHISAYNLTYEEHTRLAHLARRGSIEKHPDEDALRDYYYLVDTLHERGYDHYELSNFAFRGMHSRHNSSYWDRVPYLGFGPSAHSYLPESRYANVAHLHRYIEYLQQGTTAIDFRENLSPTDCLNETIMTGLRRAKGVDLQNVSEVFGREKLSFLQTASEPYLAQGLLILDSTSQYSIEAPSPSICKERVANEGQFLRASREGMLVIDSIISDLFLL